VTRQDRSAMLRPGHPYHGRLAWRTICYRMQYRKAVERGRRKGGRFEAVMMRLGGTTPKPVRAVSDNVRRLTNPREPTVRAAKRVPGPSQATPFTTCRASARSAPALTQPVIRESQQRRPLYRNRSLEAQSQSRSPSSEARAPIGTLHRPHPARSPPNQRAFRSSRRCRSTPTRTQLPLTPQLRALPCSSGIRIDWRADERSRPADTGCWIAAAWNRVAEADRSEAKTGTTGLVLEAKPADRSAP
jgi:hypothetical protein